MREWNYLGKKKKKNGICLLVAEMNLNDDKVNLTND